MSPEEAIETVLIELRRAEEKFPGWPDDVVHAAAIVAEESGELVQAALDYYYTREVTKFLMVKEAAHTGAMAIRFLLGLKELQK
jgi:hypothetical protein